MKILFCLRLQENLTLLGLILTILIILLILTLNGLEFLLACRSSLLDVPLVLILLRKIELFGCIVIIQLALPIDVISIDGP